MSETQELAKYRLTAAWERCHAAEKLLEDSCYKDAVNRAYYAIFLAMRAVLALEGVDFKRHSGVIAYFRQNYIKTGIFDVEYSDMIGDAFLIRTQSDYEDFYVIEKEEAAEQCRNAALFCETVKKYIKKAVAK